jgi:hypothetical protein
VNFLKKHWVSLGVLAAIYLIYKGTTAAVTNAVVGPGGLLQPYGDLGDELNSIVPGAGVDTTVKSDTGLKY